MNDIVIRHAVTSDANGICKFIAKFWNSNHILSKNDEFFSYEFCVNDICKFILAIDQCQNIIGLLGYYSDSNQPQADYDVYTAMWMVKPGTGNPTLGLKLHIYFKETVPHRFVHSIGVNPKVIKLYEYLGFRADCMKHYVFINRQKENFKILNDNSAKALTINYKFYDEFIFCKVTDLQELKSFFNVKDSRFHCNKTFEFFNKRYIEHPLYRYHFYTLYDDANCSICALVCREEYFKTALILRIIDFIGYEDGISRLGRHLNNLCINNGYEYIDFYLYGIDSESMREAGFSYVDQSSDHIVPNYFHPFVAKNIQLLMVTNHKENHLKLFKGDGDQDRPN